MKRFLAAMAALLLAFAGAACAQSWPAKPVRLVVGFAAGGTTDVVARIVAQRLGESWGQNMLVENRAGASGMIAADVVAKSAPDGYTLLLTPQTSLAVAPALTGAQPEVRDRLVQIGVDLVGNSPEEFSAFLRSEIARYARVIKEAGIKAD
jgi:tripartite-type tricarboxylate transporter receptor subunit TctC